jgi:hypothetical protein
MIKSVLFQKKYNPVFWLEKFGISYFSLFQCALALPFWNSENCYSIDPIPKITIPRCDLAV